MDELDERLTRAFADVFAAKRCYFWGGTSLGGPGYHGVRAVAVIPDGSEVDLAVTFREGTRYCCFESACHFAHYNESEWNAVRESLDRHGLAHLPLPVVRTFRGVVKHGAVMGPGTDPPACFVSEGSEYQVGPWRPVGPGV